MSDGVMLPLGEICRNASRRFAPPEDGKVWFINTGDVESGRFTHNDLSDWEGLPGQAKKAVVEGDILYSEIRPGNGRYAFVDKQHPNAVVSTKFMVIEAGESILPKYLYHVITSPELQNAMKLIAESRSGTFPQITFDSIAHLELMVPSKAEQLAVSSLLDAIEGRIRNNQKMNQTLEEIAKAIFKSWFVDFDPVRAKVEGRPTGLPPEISDLFPDEFVDSEIGEIPKGWNIASLESMSSNRSKSIKPDQMANFSCYIGLEHLPRGRVFLSNWGNPSEIQSSKTVFEQGDILFGKLRPYFEKSAIAPTDGVCSTDIVAIEPNANAQIFVACLVSQKRFFEFTSQGSTGTRMPRTSWKHMCDFKFAAPSDQLVEQFQSMMSPLVERAMLAISECKTLSELRDTLLPKLVSGELRVPDAEKFLEMAGI